MLLNVQKTIRAILLKKQGKENLRDPLGQYWNFFNPLAKNGYFPYPKQEFFTPSDNFCCDPPDSFVQF